MHADRMDEPPSRALGNYDFRYDPSRHETARRHLRQERRVRVGGSCRLCLRHRNHPSFFVRKLWDYFIPVPPSRSTQSKLQKLYTAKYEVRPVVTAILKHPALYTAPRMVKSPVVYTAGLLRATGRGIDSQQWFRLSALAGQRLFYPPNVAGWDETRWLDTATFRGRWNLAAFALKPSALDPKRDAAPRPAPASSSHAPRHSSGTPCSRRRRAASCSNFARRTWPAPPTPAHR